MRSGRDLSAEGAGRVLGEIMAGEASETQIAAFLIALRTKGETVEELAGLATTMRALATPVKTARENLLDLLESAIPERAVVLAAQVTHLVQQR